MKSVKSSKLYNSAYHRLVASQLIGESTLIYPLYSIMFSERSNISAVGVGALLAGWQITQIIAEIPTGIIADKFSKKYSIIAGRLFKAFCFVFWFFAPSFWGYFAGFVLWGIGEAFISGATQAYLYELNEGKKDKSYLKSYSRLKSLEMLAYTVTYFVTFLIGPEFQLLIALSIIAMVLSTAVAFTLPTSKIIAVTTYRQIISSAKTNLKSSAILRRKFLEGLVVAGTLGMLVELIVVNYRDYGVSSKVVPLLISISTLVSATSFWLLHHYEKYFERNILALLVIFLSVFVVMFNMSMWWQIFGLFFVARYMRVLAVVQEAGLMHDISPDSRATVLSSYSLITKLLSAVQIFLVGFLAINNNITTPTFWFVVVSLSFFALLRIRDKFIAQKQSSVRV